MTLFYPLKPIALLTVLLCLVLMLPVLALLASWLVPMSIGVAQSTVLRTLWETVLPGYLWTTVLLTLGVAVGVVLLGLGGALIVTVFDFPGRRWWEWALLLPLAMPAYVVAYAYTDFLQYSGPLQTWLREWAGVQGRVFPEVRNVQGAIWVFSFTLYPYVYLLARTALTERAGHLLEAARLLGAGLSRRLITVALPLARPAVVAGMALALMETLADYGVASYFGIQTFTAGIYKAWLAMDDRLAAAQLATLLLLLVAVLLALEQSAQRKLRFVSARNPRSGGRESSPWILQGKQIWLANGLCALPVWFGFLAPVLFMLRPLLDNPEPIAWHRFADWALSSVRLASMAAVLALLLAWGLAFVLRRGASHWERAVVRLVGLGYAVPGAVVVVGLLLPVMWLQGYGPQWSLGHLLTATSAGLVWAYLVRFTAVALQSVQSGYSRLPVALDESARLLGCAPWQVWWRVHVPMLRRTSAAALLLVFVDVMKELPATLVLRPFGSDTLAVMTYQLARDERLGEAALPALVLVLVGLLPVWLISRTLRPDKLANPQ